MDNYGLFGTRNIYQSYAPVSLNISNTFGSYFPQSSFSNLTGQLNYPGVFGLNITGGGYNAYTSLGINTFNTLGQYYPQLGTTNIYNSLIGLQDWTLLQ